MDAPGSLMTDNVQEHSFVSRDEAAQACAAHLEALLTAQLAITGSSALVVTGGSSPASCYAKLAATDLNWSRVTVVPSDERWVPTDHGSSNEKMIRETLLVDRAAAARFVSMYSDHASMQEHCDALNQHLPTLPQPFAATLLGMGEDGHIASLFPDASNLSAGLDENSSDWCIAVETAASSHPRMSLTMAALMRSEQIVLLFFGDAKLDVLKVAMSGERTYPVSSLINQQHTPVHVFWAP